MFVLTARQAPERPRPSVAGAIAAGLALACVSLVVVPATARAPAASSTVAVVTNASDVVNGDVSSIAALNANPGRDGISLREALLAADHTRGSATVYIMFSRALNGRTIAPRSELPPIHRNNVVIEGVAPNGAPARVTIDGRAAPSALCVSVRGARTCVGTNELLLVQASDVTVRWLRFTGLHQQGNPTGRMTALVVRAGRESGPGSPVGPPQITNVQILDDVFDNSGNSSPGPGAVGVIIGGGGGGSAMGRYSAITIARSTFLDYTGDDALGVWAGSGVSISGVVIEDNTFDQDKYSIELGGQHLAVIGNTITGGDIPDAIGISLNTTNAVNATIDGTLIESNTISGVDGPAINIDAEVYTPGLSGSPDAAYGDVISNTQIVNDVIHAGQADDAGIYVAAGDRTGSSPSRVSGLTIDNDTLVEDGTGSLLNLIPNGPGASGNQISGVTIRNTILWDPNGTPITSGSQPMYNQPPDVLTNSLISGSGWAGSNGNINANPAFVDEAGGNYQLTAGSPAISAGTTTGAPAFDFDGASRHSPPDIGAYEYGAAANPLLSVTVEPLGGDGTVTSSPAGVSCGGACSAQFNPGAAITLVAKPDGRSRFLGWDGACSSRTSRCSVTPTTATSVTARFGPA